MTCSLYPVTYVFINIILCVLYPVACKISLFLGRVTNVSHLEKNEPLKFDTQRYLAENMGTISPSLNDIYSGFTYLHYYV